MCCYGRPVGKCTSIESQCAACVGWPVMPRVRVPCVHVAPSVAVGVRHARVVCRCGCLLLGVCETFQRVSQRGYISPFVLQGPNLGNLVACVLLMNTATMPSFIHSYITCQTSVTNIPARAAAGRRGQNVRYIPAVWQRPTSGHVRPLSKHVPVVSSCCRFTRRARASLSLSLSSHRVAKQNVAPSDGCFPSSPRLAALLTRLRLWLLLMDPVLAWLCWLWLVDEDQ